MTKIDNGMVYDDTLSGGQITFGNKVKATLTTGRSSHFDTLEISPGDPVGSYQAVEVYNNRADKILWGVGFHHWANRDLLFRAASTSAVNIWDIGLGYRFDRNISVHGAYA